MTPLVDVSQADRDRMCAEVLLSAAKSLRCMLQDDLATGLDYAAVRLTAEQANAAEIERLREALERLTTATGNLVISCTRTMVGGSDGGTYIVEAPTGNCLKAASEAVTFARAILNKKDAPHDD